MAAHISSNMNADWWVRVLKGVLSEMQAWASDPPLAADQGGAKKIDITTYKAQMNFCGSCHSVPGHLCCMNASQLDWSGLSESEASCKNVGKKFFYNKNDKPVAPLRWPQKYAFPIWTTDKEKFPAKGEPQVRLMFSSLIRAFWVAVLDLKTEKEKVEKSGGTADAEWHDRMHDFRRLASTPLFTYVFLATAQDALSYHLSECAGIEDMREEFGLTGFKRILVTMEMSKVMRQDDPSNQSPTPQKLHEYMVSNMNWGDKGPPSLDMVKHFLEMGKRFKENVLAYAAVEEAQSTYGRNTLFDEWSKVRIVTQRATLNKDLCWVCEYFLVLYHAQASLGDKSKVENHSTGDLKAKSGELSVCLITRKLVEHVINKVVPAGWGASFERYKSPKQNFVASNDKENGGGMTPDQFTAVEADDTKAAWSHGMFLKCHDFLASLLNRSFKSSIAGALASPPPAGVTPEYLLNTNLMKAKWDELDPAKKKEKEDKEEQTTKTSTEENDNEGGNESNDEGEKDNRDKLKMDLATKADSFLQNRVAIAVPAVTTMASTLEVAQIARAKVHALGRCVCFFDAKCQDDGRIRTYQSSVTAMKTFPPLDVTLAEVTFDSFDGLMMPALDFAVILCGHHGATRRWVEDKIEKLRWNFRAVQVRKVAANNKGPSSRKSSRCSKGLFRGKSSEPAYVCWKGGMPKIQHHLQAYLDPGASLHTPQLVCIPPP